MEQYRIILKKNLVEDKCITMNVDLYNKNTKTCTKVLIDAIFKLSSISLNGSLLQSLLAECKDHEVSYCGYKFTMINNEYKIFIYKTCEEITLVHMLDSI
jgi:hypothetical protein